ncbi:NUDIX hydrolase [Candidatus Woesearchaeota archaeon]|nr:NUDIX hydrolase [Candidatus Woesearchaeota archaeon]
MENKKWKILKQQYLEKNDWIKLRKDSCVTPKGKTVDPYYVMEIEDVSCAVAITKQEKIVLVKEYKHGVQKEILQLPCGYIDKNEDPFTAAKRELAEETGYTSKKWTTLGAFTGSPGRLTHYYHFFLAEDCEKTREQKLDELETLEVFEYTKEEAEEALKKQDTDLVTPLGFLMAKELWKRKE